MNRRDFLKSLAGAVAGRAFAERFPFSWFQRWRESKAHYGFDRSGKDYSAIVVRDQDGEIQQFAISTDEQGWAKITEQRQQAEVLRWGVDFI